MLWYVVLPCGHYVVSDKRHDFDTPCPACNERKRKSQEEISLAFASYYDQKNLARAISILSGHETISNHLFQAVARYQMGNFSEAERISWQAI